MPPAFPVQTSLISPATAKTFEQAPETLALIGFGSARKAGDGDGPWIETGLETLSPPPVQLWRAAGPVKRGQMGRFAVHTASGIALLATSLPDPDDPEAAAQALYSELLDTAHRLACPHPLRIWQYLPRITAAWGDEDRYRGYCAGRSRAFAAVGHDEAALPAACLLGDGNDSILLYALFAERSGRQIENPRQQSAYRYPPRYGRESPSFSRATAVGEGAAEGLFISGTSSITGHASRHAETLDQLEETLRNLEALVAHWRAGSSGLTAISPMKVYLRHRDDFDAVRTALARRLPADHPLIWLRADICRPELNIEIEGVVQPGDLAGTRLP